jgi:hypothetical protein
MSSLSELERLYFVSKNGGADRSEKVTGLKRKYWLGLFGGDRNTGFDDLEKQWLSKIITDNGGTPDSYEASSLWVEAVAALGGDPSKYINENKKQVYILDI